MLHPIGYVIYADFESILKLIDSKTPSDDIPYIQKTSKHSPCGYAYIVLWPEGKRLKPIEIYSGEDAVQRFLSRMVKEEKNIGEILMKIKLLR